MSFPEQGGSLGSGPNGVNWTVGGVGREALGGNSRIHTDLECIARLTQKRADAGWEQDAYPWGIRRGRISEAW